jgi:hypothetical protein
MMLSGREAFVVMVQATDLRDGDDCAAAERSQFELSGDLAYQTLSIRRIYHSGEALK